MAVGKFRRSGCPHVADSWPCEKLEVAKDAQVLPSCNNRSNFVTGEAVESPKMAEYKEPRHAASHDGEHYFKGSIQEAISICRSKKAFLIVFLEGAPNRYDLHVCHSPSS